LSQIQAVYRHGVFEPLEPVSLREDQRVQLSFEPVGVRTPTEWLDEIRVLQAAVVRRTGVLPDSATDIAADRER
jgi:predicted DNA-binding antitoxin AbrB/MazE fold protein